MNPNDESADIMRIVSHELRKNPKCSHVRYHDKTFTLIRHRLISVSATDIQCTEKSFLSREAMFTLNLLLLNNENPQHIILFHSDKFHIFKVCYEQ
jgi:hypothetical protein